VVSSGVEAQLRAQGPRRRVALRPVAVAVRGDDRVAAVRAAQAVRAGHVALVHVPLGQAVEAVEHVVGRSSASTGAPTSAKAAMKPGSS
jgi:hypothetical protein